jgi:putative sigma-54 modulation protein
MKYTIRGNNIDVTEALHDHVEKKLGRLEKFFDTHPEATVVLTVMKEKHKVEVTIPLPGLMLRAEEITEDMYNSIDHVVEKLERQIKKYKTKVNRKLRHEGSVRFQDVNGKGFNTGTAVMEEDEEEPFKIVRTKRFNIKPMDTEEAILQMNMLGHDFFVFSNDQSRETNIIYKRKDGRYGLIEPE